jgi:glutamyl-tRNA reductase
MSVVVVGLNHKTAPISLLERLAIAEEQSAKALHHLLNYEHVVEGAILSTCNRIEVYAVVTKFHGGAQDLRNFLAEFCHVAPEDFSDHLYTYHDEGAVRHLLRVAAGIDSMVVGESEILGQVRRAYAIAQQEAATGRMLRMAFVSALRTGKRARTETGIGRNPASISSAAVDLARRAFPYDGLAGKSVAIVGAGKMGRLAARSLAAAGATDVVIVNRSEDRARALADAFGGRVGSFDELHEILETTDIVISSTTSPGTVLDRPLVSAALENRRRLTPLFIVDIAVPRDVEVAVGDLPGVILRDIDDLRGVVETAMGTRVGEISAVEAIISEELDRFSSWQRAGASAPIAAALKAKAERITAGEIEHIRAELASMTPRQRAAVEQLAHRVAAKVLHGPLSKAKDLAGSAQGDLYLVAVRELFELDDQGDGE